MARLPPPEGMVVAVDATGLSPTAASRYFVDLTRNRGTERTRQHWPNWVVAVDVPRRVVLGQLACAGPANASALLRPVVDLARQTGVVALVLADAEFDTSAIITTSATSWALTASSRPSGASRPGSFTAFVPRCGPTSRPLGTACARWSRASSPPPSASSHHALPVVCPLRSTSRRCSWASRTTSTAFVVRWRPSLLEGCQQSQAHSTLASRHSYPAIQPSLIAST